MTRLSLALFAVVAVVTMAASPHSATAIEYPWCAQYGGRDDGARNCGFVSFEQCMDTIRGMGGFCERNLFYEGPAERPAKPLHTRRND